MIVSHEFALQKASRASNDGNYMEGICFSLLALAISDGIRNNPSLSDPSHSGTDHLISRLAMAFFQDPTNPDAFHDLQAAVQSRHI